MTNMRRLPNRSPVRPPSSSRPPNAIAYALTTHSRSVAAKCSSRWIEGSATLTIATSSTTMSCASAITIRARFRLRGDDIDPTPILVLAARTPAAVVEDADHRHPATPRDEQDERVDESGDEPHGSPRAGPQVDGVDGGAHWSVSMAHCLHAVGVAHEPGTEAAVRM